MNRDGIRNVVSQLCDCASEFQQTSLAEWSELARYFEVLSQRETEFSEAQEAWRQEVARATAEQHEWLQVFAQTQQQLALDRAALDKDREAWTAQAESESQGSAEQCRELEVVRLALVARQADLEQLETQSAQLLQEQTQLEGEVEQLRAARTGQDDELQQLRETLAQLGDATIEDVRTATLELETLCVEQQSQLALLRADLETTRSQTSRFATAAIDLADARAVILQLREEMEFTRRTATDELNQRISQLLQERTELELELEAVRGRATELLEDAEEERRRISEERVHWAGELRQLRRALEAQSQTLSDKEAALQAVQSNSLGHTAITNIGPPLAEPARASKDPVLDAVMAQFQQLQRERQQRRGLGGKGKQDVA